MPGLKVNTIPARLDTIQALVRFNFCWRALNWWPILEGPPLPPAKLLWADQFWYKWAEAAFKLCSTNCAPLRNSRVPHLLHRLRSFNCYRPREDLVMKPPRRPRKKQQQKKTICKSMLKQTPPSVILKAVWNIEYGLLLARRRAPIPCLCCVYVGVEDSVASICCLAQPLSQMDSGPGAFN